MRTSILMYTATKRRARSVDFFYMYWPSIKDATVDETLRLLHTCSFCSMMGMQCVVLTAAENA
jgi:hypothetical protein